MRLDRFTEKAQEALQDAAQLATEMTQQAVLPEHLLLTLVRQEQGIARTILESCGVSLAGLDAIVPGLHRRLEAQGLHVRHSTRELIAHLMTQPAALFHGVDPLRLALHAGGDAVALRPRDRQTQTAIEEVNLMLVLDRDQDAGQPRPRRAVVAADGDHAGVQVQLLH